MQLILWRHAEAVDGFPDLKRELTHAGHRQARDMANWLQTRLPKDFRIIVSPAERARQTASALTFDFEVSKAIAPGASCDAVLDASGWPHAGGTVVVVGHQPTLGETAATLLAGRPLAWTIKKGAIWWLHKRTSRAPMDIVLKAVMSPGLLAKEHA